MLEENSSQLLLAIHEKTQTFLFCFSCKLPLYKILIETDIDTSEML